MLSSFPRCKGFVLALLMLTGFDRLAHASVSLPDSLKTVLEAAVPRGEIIYRTVLETIMQAYPDQNLAVLQLAQTIAPDWMAEEELDLIDREAAAVQAALERSRARGVWYYLDPVLWNTRFDFGGGVTTGDTQENTVFLALHVDRSFNKGWSHSADINVDLARRLGVTSRERIVADFTTRKQISERAYGLQNMRLEIDRFSGYDYRLNVVTGLGYRFFDADSSHQLAVELGLGMRFNKLSEPVPGRPLTLSEFIGRTDLRYSWAISDNLTLENRGTAFLGTNSITLEDQISLIAKINSHLSAQFSFLTNYESDAPDTSSALDTVTRASFSYSF